ncbi:MAG TPA: homoserine dehydrogenase [Candidatus Dormibacteraeota bacterium]|nr:homoserine dehydrogenase [Candidatus Dormibacteraeota bacterium]
MRRPARVLLAGPGRVGSAFLELAAGRPELEVAAVVRSTGPTVAELLAEGGWDVVADATPSDLATGGPALAHARAALGAGVHFATAAKGPLVRDHGALRELARRTGTGFRFSAATGAALPTVDMAEFALAGARVVAIEGVLNGTSNYVLDRMAESVDLETALAEARRRGIADGDGRPDVAGVDTAVKLVAIANAVWGTDLTLEDVAVTGIEGLDPDLVRGAARTGGAVRLIGRAAPEDSRVRAEVRPSRVAGDHPLAGVRGADKAITFETDSMGRLTLSGGRSDPRAAGAALLRDVLLLLRVGPRA